MGLKKYAAVQADDCILNVQWADDHLCVTPVTGAILVVDKEGEITSALPDHGLGNGASSATPDLVATCGFDGRVRLHSLPACESIAEVKLGRSVIERVVWSPDGQHLAVGFGKNLLILDRKGENRRHLRRASDLSDRCSLESQHTREVASVSGGGARMWRLGATEPFAKFDWGGASLSVAGARTADGSSPATRLQASTSTISTATIPCTSRATRQRSRPWRSRPMARSSPPVAARWSPSGIAPQRTAPRDQPPASCSFTRETWKPSPGRLMASTSQLETSLDASSFPPMTSRSRPFRARNNITSLAWNADSSLLAVGDGDGLVVVFQAV